MRIFVYVCLGLVGLFVLLQAFIMKSTRDTEQHKYVVLKKYAHFEVRQYAPAVFSTVKMSTSTYKESSSKGFRILANYIFGGNEKSQSIAMTSPVRMELDDSMKMAFMVPASMQQEDLPKPMDGQIKFEKEEQKIMAAIEFGGWADDASIEKYKKILRKELESHGLEYNEKFMFLGYNPPYEMIGRRNEVIVEVLNYKSKNDRPAAN